MNKDNSAAINVPAAHDSLEKIVSLLNDIFEDEDCPDEERFKIELAVEEIFVNIADYAYENIKGNVDVTIQIKTENDIKTIEITFIDGGKPFDPLLHEDPNISLPPEKREIGGLGIMLMKKNMDSVSYSFVNNSNKTTLSKSWSGKQ
ncbi:histidine kinase [Spirochaetia bacterium]|nr:histidine kinase [Spirochaetia bacterium]